MGIRWTEGMSVGVREFDEHHRHLFSLVDKVQAAADEHGTNEDLRLLLNEIANFALYHLDAEEECMNRFDCTYQAHVEAHKQFRVLLNGHLGRVETAARDGSLDAAKFASELAEFTATWHVEHILTMDKGYTRCFHEHGLY